MMTFEEWWWPRKPLGDDLISGDVVTVAARAAWEAGIQEGIQRMYKLYDICPECREAGGRHKMDCGRGRKSDE